MAVILGHARIVRRLIRYLDSLARTPPELGALFEKHRPALVLATMLLDSSVDLPMLREARRRGVRTVGMVRSWDNLSTYGFLRFLPDRFVAQNLHIRDSAVQKHDVDPHSITITGVPHYDRHHSREHIESRESFCKKLGIDPAHDIVLYAAIGDFLFPKEHTLASLFEDIIVRGKLSAEARVIFRKHPAHDTRVDGAFRYVIFDPAPSSVKDQRGASAVMDESHTRHLINSLFHASVVVSASGTSMLIDGATFDKPLISVAFDGPSSEPYWLSVKRFSDHADHSRALIALGGVAVVESEDELVATLNAYLGDPRLRAAGRESIVERFAAPFDGNASKRLAAVILEELRDRFNPRELSLPTSSSVLHRGLRRRGVL